MFLFRPILAKPPVYNMGDLKVWVTLSDVLDAHEVLDLRAANSEKIQKQQQPTPGVMNGNR